MSKDGADRMKPSELDDRSGEILKSVIQAHVITGEPVGSRTLSRGAGLDLSPATIRNVMSDLEERGLLSQPHASAGRVPTDLAYRLFVDRLMSKPAIDEKQAQAIDDALRERRREIPELFAEAARQQYDAAKNDQGMMESRIRKVQQMLRDNETFSSAAVIAAFGPVLGEGGRPEGVLAIVVETTQQVLAERALAKAEERLRQALNASGMVAPTARGSSAPAAPAKSWRTWAISFRRSPHRSSTRSPRGLLQRPTGRCNGRPRCRAGPRRRVGRSGRSRSRCRCSAVPARRKLSWLQPHREPTVCRLPDG